MKSSRVFVSVLGTILSCLFVRAYGTRVPELSFEKPFDQISAEGVREITNEWNFGGHAVVNRHFVRLTTDRQRKRGYVWSKRTLNAVYQDFSVVLTFRISGQGEFWFGDGLGVWITTEQRHTDGENHGFLEKYTGFGVVLDTFVNTEHTGGHKDILFVENDGTKSLDEVNYNTKLGCDAKGIRYHEKNANFSPSKSMSRLKISVKQNKVTISVDPNHTGEWQPCFDTTLTLPANWAQSATIGLTASTGSLADNHDVIGVAVYDQSQDAEAITKDTSIKNSLAPVDIAAIAAEGNEADVNEQKVRKLKAQYDQMIEDFDHQFTALKEETQNTISKLRKQEEDDARRIQELEQWFNGKVSQKVESSLQEIHQQVEKKLDTTISENHSSGWKVPFLLLIVGIGIGAFIGYKKYQELRKSHLL